MIDIKNLTVTVDGKSILKNISLSVPDGEVHAIMGPNGAGKSTLGFSLAGKPGYDVEEGSVLLDGIDILSMSPSERACHGLYLSFQYPVEIPGVPVMTFIKTAINAQRKFHNQPEMSSAELLKKAKNISEKLKINFDMLKRPFNVGFSGGEKKKIEILQIALLEPKLIILDETDSGLDIDALKIVSNGVNDLRSDKRSIIVITHYQRLLDYIKPDRVHILAGGQIVHSGDKSVALELENKGYDLYVSQ